MRTFLRTLVAVPAIAFALLAYLYLTLPDVRALKTTNPTTTAFMDLRDREARDKRRQPRRVQRWVRYGRVSQDLKRAVLVAEDDAFWQHEGVDFEQLQESRSGRHQTAVVGEGATEMQATRAYEFGDSVAHMDIPGSMINAMLRSGPGLPLRCLRAVRPPDKPPRRFGISLWNQPPRENERPKLAALAT